ncbi:SDR family NAD(P)-dependent oxidoreductase [Knoellia subterranea]|uniref:Short-chain dehydrogenase n=1 Tax=Knoellia subterranea KCTC 19937 TaxID=1385521 RepID=A0A0A0JQY1_9MICO|nr:SDR family NAD(P)-dependent oxidoreductase [Knoellia subterranea]KGN39583.1 hypothetical protein N803_01740 [Knoellia subterranea KCTC 19937]
MESTTAGEWIAMTVVMTGGSSGFGSVAAQRLRDSGATVIVGSRAESGRAELDLTDLASVRAFARGVAERSEDEPIGTVLLNAGLVRAHDRDRTPDGIETTFAVNHLAHYLLLRLLLPVLADGARVVLTARHAQTLPEVQSRRIRLVAFDPGQVFGTGLARDLALPMRFAWAAMGTRLGSPVRAFNPHMNTVPAAGRALAGLATEEVGFPGVAPPGSGVREVGPGHAYAALRRGRLSWTQPSALAQRPDVAKQLWDDSAELVGLPR